MLPSSKIHFFSLIFLVLPASSTYELRDFGFGTGGAANATSSNYALEALTGEQQGGKLAGTTYGVGTGLIFTNQANVPVAPTFVNDGNYYSKLRLTINESGNPSDTKYAIAISSDGFTTTEYVQDDNRLGSTLGLEDYRTYSSFGGSGGFLILGLAGNTTYQVKIKAWQGKFTETGYGPTASAATIGATLTFDIDVAATDTETSTPFTTAFGNLLPATVTTSGEKIWVDFVTNAENGGTVFVSGLNSGLRSSSINHTITALTSDLTAVSEGYGAQGTSAAQASGGPFTLDSAYNVASNNVATIDSTVREIFAASLPVTGGRGSFQLKAKASAVTPAAGDYQETLTVVSAANF
jgi:hypothetical protein